MIAFRSLALAGLIALLGGGASAQILNPDNGHYYLRVDSTSLDWTQSKAAAESLTHLGLTGHLATITSQAEQDFIFNTLGQAVLERHFLGGFQTVTSPADEPSSGWKWITGEAWSYTNWGNEEPNNFGAPEDFLQMRIYGQWNDQANIAQQGYIVEFEPAAVPEPGTFALLATGILPALGFRRRKSARSPR